MGRESGVGDPEVVTLVERLVEAAGRCETRRSAVGGDADVLLDVEVEGVRCLLIRLGETEVSRQPALSPREREIVRMVAQGYPNKTIAAVLEISAWTVSTHVRRVFAKLSVNSRAAMVAMLITDGQLRQTGASTLRSLEPGIRVSAR
jgi:DNA-binding CsgD family transcriptional regulator